jgi:5-methylcytosine-specific restriction endonuclease McrA
MEVKRCTICGEVKPATHDYWGSTPSGNFRGYCNECMNRRSREYEAKNKDKRRVRDTRRATSGGGIRRTFSLAEKKQLFDRQNGNCPGCFQSIERPELGEVDHLRPLSRGGIDDRPNFILMHPRCNRDKKQKTLPEYWEWRVRVGMDDENLGRKNGLIP